MVVVGFFFILLMPRRSQLMFRALAGPRYPTAIRRRALVDPQFWGPRPDYPTVFPMAIRRLSDARAPYPTNRPVPPWEDPGPSLGGPTSLWASSISTAPIHPRIQSVSRKCSSFTTRFELVSLLTTGHTWLEVHHHLAGTRRWLWQRTWR